MQVRLPVPLCTLLGLAERTQVLDVDGPVTQRSVLDALEARHPALVGTIRDRGGERRRRAFIRFFACEEDLSHTDPDDPLPDAVAEGREPYLVVGAMAGG
ncbi:MAG: hypothetical protein CMH83_22680 [Nocardioides sp.]|nr:hypothetical protein [Nocardioides sp.]